MNEHLISSKEMAQFVAAGYLKFEEMVPKDLSDACLEDMKNHRGYLEVGTPFEETWPTGSPLGDVFRLPQVKGLSIRWSVQIRCMTTTRCICCERTR